MSSIRLRLLVSLVALLALVDSRGKDWCRALLSVVNAPAK